MISVVILSHERPRLLRQCIESLYANTPQDQFSACIVNDAGLDFRVGKYLRSLTHKNLTVLDVQNSGHVLAQLKNLGVFYTRQHFGTPEWLYIGDSDTAFLPGWSERMINMAVASEPMEFRLWGGQVHPFHHPIETLSNASLELNMTEHSVLDGPSWFMRWKTWRDFGPFPRTTAPGPCQSEEYPFCQRLTAAGFRIGVTYPHCVIHTGLTQGNGNPAPGAAERRVLIPEGVLAE